jgi:hypothetical protein
VGSIRVLRLRLTPHLSTPSLHAQTNHKEDLYDIEIDATQALHDVRQLNIPHRYAPNAAGDAYELWFDEEDVQVRHLTYVAWLPADQLPVTCASFGPARI